MEIEAGSQQRGGANNLADSIYQHCFGIFIPDMHAKSRTRIPQPSINQIPCLLSFVKGLVLILFVEVLFWNCVAATVERESRGREVAAARTNLKE
jgi:hypothetical protein